MEENEEKCIFFAFFLPHSRVLGVWYSNFAANLKKYMIMKAQNYLFAILAVVLMGCTKAQVAEQQTIESEDSTEAYSLEPEIDTMNLVIEEEPYIPVVAVDPVVEKTTYASSSYSSSSYESESESDY